MLGDGNNTSRRVGDNDNSAGDSTVGAYRAHERGEGWSSRRDGGLQRTRFIRDKEDLKLLAKVVEEGGARLGEERRVFETLDIACLGRVYYRMGWDMLDNDSKDDLRRIIAVMPGLDRIVAYSKLPEFLSDIERLREINVVYTNENVYADKVETGRLAVLDIGQEYCGEQSRKALKETAECLKTIGDEYNDTSVLQKGSYYGYVAIDFDNKALINDSEAMWALMAIIHNSPNLCELRFRGKPDASGINWLLDAVKFVKCVIPKSCRVVIEEDVHKSVMPQMIEVMSIKKDFEGIDMERHYDRDVQRKIFESFYNEESLQKLINNGENICDLLEDVSDKKLNKIRMLICKKLNKQELIMISNKLKRLEDLLFEGVDDVMQNDQIEQDSLKNLRVVYVDSNAYTNNDNKCTGTSAAVKAIVERASRLQVLEICYGISGLTPSGQGGWQSLRKLEVVDGFENMQGFASAMLQYCSNVESLGFLPTEIVDSGVGAGNMRMKKVDRVNLKSNEGGEAAVVATDSVSFLGRLGDFFPNVRQVCIWNNTDKVKLSDVEEMVRNAPESLEIVEFIGGDFDVVCALSQISSLKKLSVGCCNEVMEQLDNMGLVGKYSYMADDYSIEDVRKAIEKAQLKRNPERRSDDRDINSNSGFHNIADAASIAAKAADVKSDKEDDKSVDNGDNNQRGDNDDDSNDNDREWQQAGGDYEEERQKNQKRGGWKLLFSRNKKAAAEEEEEFLGLM